MKLYTKYCKKQVPLYIICFLVVLISSMNCKASYIENIQSVLFLIDVSGSMNGVKIDSVKSATKQIIKMLLPCNIEISAMGYSGKKDNPIKYYHKFSTNEANLLSFIDSLVPEGNTPLGSSLKAASYYFKNNKNPKSVKQTIILLGDGRSDDNITEALKEIKERNSLIHCECIGFDIENDKLAEDQMKKIALETGGEYYVAPGVSDVIKAFYKPGIKAIIREIPVIVRKSSTNFNFQLNSSNIKKILTSQYWIVDSVQINISPNLYDITKLIIDENMQDTLPKSIVFENNNKISLFVNKGTGSDANKKWLEGKYNYDINSLTINIQNHFFKLAIKKIENRSLVLCVNKYKDSANDMVGNSEEVCDCRNIIDMRKPYILIFFSQAGCK